MAVRAPVGPLDTGEGPGATFDEAADLASPMTKGLGSVLAGLYAKLKSLATGSRPEPLAPPDAEQADQAPPKAGPGAGADLPTVGGSNAAPGA